jgi:hypothetical protein
MPSIYAACHANDVRVILTADEIALAMKAGEEARKWSLEHNQHNKRQLGERNGVTDLWIMQLGYIGEYAVCKALGIRWHSSNRTYQNADIKNTNIEVRVIGLNHYGLRVYPHDADTRRVVGIVIEKGKEAGPLRIPGWINARYAKKKQWLMDPLERGQPIYCVPQACLFPLSQLIELLKREGRSGMMFD